MKAIILNSGRGSRLKEYTKNVPKAMVTIDNNNTIFSKAINILREFDIDEFIITTGYLNETLQKYILTNFSDLNISFVYNPIYDITNYIQSLDYIDDNIKDDFLLLHGDLIFDKEVVEMLISNRESCVVTDSNIPLPKKDFKAKIKNQYVKKISVDYFKEDAVACQPFYKLNKPDWIKWKKEIRKFCINDNNNVYAEEALNNLLNSKIQLKSVDIDGFFCSEIDTVEDLKNYKNYRG